MNKQPHVIDFGKIGSPPLGYLTIAQNDGLPFEIQRVYWTYYSPHEVVRGHHAHHVLEQLIFAVSGRIHFQLEHVSGQKHDFVLDQPHIGLYIPGMYWRTFQMSHNAVLLCLASKPYDEADYIRDYQTFKSLAR